MNFPLAYNARSESLVSIDIGVWACMQCMFVYVVEGMNI